MRKLQLVHDYTKCMGGVYRNAELLDSYCSVRESTKWTKKVASQFPEESFLNARILYKKSGGQEPLLRFKLDCNSALLAASSTDPMAPNASDKVEIFLNRFPQLLKSRLLRRNVKFVARKDKERRADTHGVNVTLSQVFVKHPALRFITPSDISFIWQLAKNN